MYYKYFKSRDVIHSAIVTYPEYEFLINNQNVYLNRETAETGDFSNKVKHVNQGFLSLTEMNINRESDKLVTPFVVFDGSRTAYFSSSLSDLPSIPQGSKIYGAYPMSASISRIYYDESKHVLGDVSNYPYIQSLKNPIELSGMLSTNLDHSQITEDDVNILGIPSIFYGSTIKRGSISLSTYITGTLAGVAQDVKKNGEMIETYGPNSGSVVGVALYEQGLLVLTASSGLSNYTTDHGNAGAQPSWLNFGSGISEVLFESNGSTAEGSNQSVSPDVTYTVAFKGTNKIPTMTLMAHANKGEFNYSNNPTFVDYDNQVVVSSDKDYFIEKNSKAKNIKKSKYSNHEEDFENTTYISQIGVYDRNKNLIAIAKLANPVKKTEIQDYLFKLRLDF